MPWKGQPFGWGQPVPYLGYLPEPTDAGVNVLRQLDEMIRSGEELSGGSIDVGVNWLEPPSVDLVTELLLVAHNLEMKINRKVEAVPKPDPRKSKARFNLWKYRFKNARVAVPRPPENLIKSVAKLAATPYRDKGNFEEAARMSRQLTPEHLPTLLGVMVHPPRVQDAIAPWIWLQRVQLATAQCVAAVEMRHKISLVDSVLLDVCRGPVDWVMDASVIALTQRVRHYRPDESAQLAERIISITERLPAQGHPGTMEVCLASILLLPKIDDQLKNEVQTALDEIHTALER